MSALFNLQDLIRSFFFAMALWFLAHSIAAWFTTTEDGIDQIDIELRKNQAVNLAGVAAIFALIFWFSL